MLSRMFNKSIRYLVTYTQGQSPEPKIREYFYYIDHQGMLFLDDAKMKNFTSCFKDKKFLAFFFKHLRKNYTNRYFSDFPYVSLCGRERNYIRCDDYPIVFTHVIKCTNSEEELFSHNHAADLLTAPFQPSKIYMSPETGRIYHPAPEHYGKIGLIQSKTAVEFSKLFTFKDSEQESEPTHFTWNNKTYKLDLKWYNDAVNDNS